MRRICLAVLVVVLVLVSERLVAAEPRYEGQQSFGLDLLPASRIGSEGTWGVMVWAWSAENPIHGATAEVRLKVSPGIEISEEDLVRTVPIGRTGAFTKNWFVKLVSKGHGVRHIGGTIRVPTPDSQSYDEQELELDVKVDGDAIQVVTKQPVRTIHVDHGQRFRYGGKYLVAIDASETASPKKIDTRPVTSHEVTATCSQCAMPDSQRVDLVVSVGTDGSVTWVRPRGEWETKVSPEVWAAASRSTREWRFNPARSEGKPVADWALVRVTVVRSR